MTKFLNKRRLPMLLSMTGYVAELFNVICIKIYNKPSQLLLAPLQYTHFSLQSLQFFFNRERMYVWLESVSFTLKS